MSASRARIALLLGFAFAAGCNPAQQQTISLLPRAETFQFKYAIVTPGSDGIYRLKLPRQGGCTDIPMTEAELVTALQTMTYTFIVARATTVVPFTGEEMTSCNTFTEYRRSNPDLVIVTTDANGNIASEARPTVGGVAVARARLSVGGALQLSVFGININAQTDSRAADAGPVTFINASVPADAVGGATGDLYDAAIMQPAPYFKLTITNVLTGPSRITGDFAFTAKKDASILIVWDGEFVLRTDL